MLAAYLPGVAGIDQAPALDGAGNAPPVVQAAEEVGLDRLARLDLDRDSPRARFDQQIDFVPGLVPPEKQIPGAGGVVFRLEQLGRDEVLEQVAAAGMDLEFGGAANAEQESEQADIDEVQLGSLDQPFVEALELVLCRTTSWWRRAEFPVAGGRYAAGMWMRRQRTLISAREAWLRTIPAQGCKRNDWNHYKVIGRDKREQDSQAPILRAHS